MCWNEDVSLNTFLFSSFVLLLIIYNNEYTKYKIQTLGDLRTYLFIASIISMQLVEYFIWRNVKNPFYNELFSIIALLVLTIQPIFSMMLLSETNLRNLLLLIYTSLATPTLIHTFMNKNIHTSIGNGGHISWHFLADPFTKYRWFVWIIWLFFFSFSLIYDKRWFIISYSLISLAVICYNYYKYKSVGSVWCWSVNSIMIFYAFYLLIVLPFYEKANIC
jgi:hypothetical protein